MPVRRLLVLLVAGTLLLGACGGSAGGASGAPAAGAGASPNDGRLQVVTTVAPITSIVAQVAGDAADITGIVPEGTNSHTFEPAPSVAKVLSRADVIFVNGLKLEDPTRKLAERNTRKGARIVELGTTVLPEDEWIYDFSFPKREGKPNPHLWTDPKYAKRYAEVVRDTLVQADPDHADTYRANEDAFARQVDAFDRAMRTAFATLPADQRKLLTYHDAYAYFAKDYDWKVIGAIQVESFDDPSAKEVADLIAQVKREKVKAIFGSEVFPSPVLEQIGKEANVTYVDVLRDDDLPGKPGQPEHSWLGLMRFDYQTMTEALGGDATALKDFPVTNVAVDKAVYPQ
jgi:ABC-type Zn uptake system ZnuABC Zn-binding protein ZnuA